VHICEQLQKRGLKSVTLCEVAKHFLRPHLIFQTIWGWGDLGSFQLPQSNFPQEVAWNLGWLYLAPHEDNSIQLLGIANNYNGLPYLVYSVWLAEVQNLIPLRHGRFLQWQQNRS